MTKITAAITALIVLSACASQSEDIATQYTSDLIYQSYDCQQLGVEARRVDAGIATTRMQVDKLANDDAAQMGVGLILFWPALFFLEGGDGPEAAQYARLKGEAVALQEASRKKKC